MSLLLLRCAEVSKDKVEGSSRKQNVAIKFKIYETNLFDSLVSRSSFLHSSSPRDIPYEE